jgi:hypothetical protein
MIVDTRARAPMATTQKGYLRSAVTPPQKESVTGDQPSEPISNHRLVTWAPVDGGIGMAKSRKHRLVRSMRHEMNRLRLEVKLGRDELVNHRGKVERTRERERRSSLGNPSGRAAAVACWGEKARLSEPGGPDSGADATDESKQYELRSMSAPPR